MGEIARTSSSRVRSAGAPRAHRADPARRCAARGRHRQRHPRRRGRHWPAAVDRRARPLGVGHAAAVWGAKLDPHFVEVCAGTCATPRISTCEPMLNLAEYRRHRNASPTICRGRDWSRRASCSTRTARCSAPHGFGVRTSRARPRPSWWHDGPAQQCACAGWAPAGRSSSRRAAPGATLSAQPVSGPGLGSSMPSAARNSCIRRALRERLLPDVRLFTARRNTHARRPG